MPFAWPPSNDETILETKINDTTISIIGTEEESIIIDISDDSETLHFESCKITINSFGYFKMA